MLINIENLDKLLIDKDINKSPNKFNVKILELINLSSYSYLLYTSKNKNKNIVIHMV